MTEMDPRVQPVTMPKWGLSMKVGKVVEWLVREGDRISPGQDLADIETEKIAGTLESTQTGVVRRILAAPRQDVPVSGVIALVAPAEVDDATIEAAAQAARGELAELSAALDTGEGDDGPAESTETIGEHTVSYATVGDGAEVVLLVHGFGGDRNSWLFVQEPLAQKGFTVHAVDLPGHGTSSKTLTPGVSLADLADVVLTLLDRLGAGRAHLVGHSMGGAVAAAVAARRPDRVASVLLAAPAGLGPSIDEGYLRGFAAGASRRELKPLLERLFADPALVTRQLVDDVVKYKRLDGVGTSLTAALGVLLTPEGGQAIDAGALIDSAQAAGVPVRVVWGMRDTILPPPAKGPDGVRFTVVPAAGHMVHMEAPDVVLDELGDAGGG